MATLHHIPEILRSATPLLPVSPSNTEATSSTTTGTISTAASITTAPPTLSTRTKRLISPEWPATFPTSRMATSVSTRTLPPALATAHLITTHGIARVKTCTAPLYQLRSLGYPTYQLRTQQAIRSL